MDNVTGYTRNGIGEVMTTAIALSKSDVPVSVPEMMQVAQFLQHATAMLPRHLQGEPSSLFAVMLKARALNIPMATAFDAVIVQDGKTGLTATLMQALVIRAGYHLFLSHQDDSQATVRAERPGIGPNQEGHAYVSFSLADAETAELIKIVNGKVTARSAKGFAKPWETYTRDMLVWRAISRAVKLYFPDVLMGMVYTPDELGAEVDSDGTAVRVDAIRVDVIDDQVKKAILRIRGAETVDSLRRLYQELSDDDMLSELTPDGLTLSQLVGNRKTHLEENAAKAAAAAERAAKKAAAAEAAKNNPVPPGETELIRDTLNTMADEVVEGTREAAQDADVAGATEQPSDTAMNPRRRAVLTVLDNQLGAYGETAVVEHFDRYTQDVGTAELKEWLANLRKQAITDEEAAAIQTLAEQSSTPEPEPENAELSFDELGSVAPEQAPADEDTATTERRIAVLAFAAKHFGGDEPAETAAVEQFGRPLDTIGTPALQQWLADTRKASN